ncbi:hypothetical protein ACFP3I_15360 [Chryseobacterium arachidis]
MRPPLFYIARALESVSPAGASVSLVPTINQSHSSRWLWLFYSVAIFCCR